MNQPDIALTCGTCGTTVVMHDTDTTSPDRGTFTMPDGWLSISGANREQFQEFYCSPRCAIAQLQKEETYANPT